MVYLHFPSQFTEEEEMLQKKYQKLKRKKKALQMLKAPKQETPPPQPVKRALEAKPDAKELAKKLLKSGMISAFKVENKERQGFKRPKALERKRFGCEKISGSVTGYQPFTASHALEEEEQSKSGSESPTGGSSSGVNNRPPVKKLYKHFVSARETEIEGKEERAREHERGERDHDGKPERPRQGHTIYVRGYGVTQEILQKAFEPMGNIKDISMEMDKNCGFVTFEKTEFAEKAIKEMNGTTVSGVQLSVSLARNQPLIPPASGDTSCASWVSLAGGFPQKVRHEDKRDVVSYDDVL